MNALEEVSKEHSTQLALSHETLRETKEELELKAIQTLLN